ncbi:hypothetical protein AGABI2DRAFT_177171 [Agaricus bisporus var. bisporus H97]|uniref:hypothetical protein n=1 Tax=Agaricus bisporus var. bisporus (strain H97 / ATCC MYA-4626 / FGSC 10389) TaxID=936046 RepID=UPI00029F74D7|nr:hypothetical protein AGABI2DRAFT_177171 [Agaricus bisporus var. bisporus H97]EKV49003.1 hypothetical protein AGABI2DRAFT_177171 [Agaricus bisporus var. bisporus H97]
MAQLARVAQYLDNRYPRPKVDPEWLQGCYEWLTSLPGADPTSQKFLDDVVAQLLQSDLTDSMLQGTGIPIGVTQTNSAQANSYLGGTPILVEIVAITEIGTSAYQLEQIRATREERMRLGQTEDGGEDEADLEVEGEGPVPRYPRGMLRFDLSDGSTTINAIEFRPIPEIILGQTQLGYKMLLKNPVIRHGIAFLEQNSVELLGYQTADREALQKMDFARGLRFRMGLPLEPVHAPENEPTLVAHPARSPLREISPPLEPINPRYNDDANLEPLRRKVPSNTATQASTSSSATLVSPNHSVSPYFSSSSNPTASDPVSTSLNGFNLNLTSAQASQVPPPPADDDDNDSEALFNQFDSIDLFVAAEENNENLPPPALPSIVPPVASSSSTSAPSANIAGPSSSTRSKKSPVSRSLFQEDSIEIVSFTPGLSQSFAGSQNKGKNKEKDSSPPSNNHNSTRPRRDSIELDPDIRANLDELQFATYSDPEFLRQQREALAHHNATQMTQGTGIGKGKGRDMVMSTRPIKPLPRRSLSSQPRTSQTKDVIEIESDDSAGLSPPPPINPARAMPLFIADSDEDEDGPIADDYDDDDDDDDGIYWQDEDEYDKENVPVMTRHVKRKVSNTQGGASRGEFGGGDVIELSDED